MLRVLAGWLVVVAGCYEPKLSECVVRCGGDADCAPSQVCRADGWCVTPGFTDACDGDPGALVPVDASIDASARPDAASSSADASVPPPPIDAPPVMTCAPGCPGSCENGVCVIRCLGEQSCHEQVQCPATGPCTVLCAGARSCDKGVQCGLGRCTVACSGDEACKKRVRCEAACACDVSCSGDGSCKEPAACSKPWCDTGDGCTSTAPACNAC